MAQTTAAGKVRIGVPYDLTDACVAPIVRNYGDQYRQLQLIRAETGVECEHGRFETRAATATRIRRQRNFLQEWAPR